MGRNFGSTRAWGGIFPSPIFAQQGYRAILLAFGLHRSRDLQIPGNELDGVIKGIDFLLNVNLGYRFSIGKRVVVIGGGNVAIDVARSAIREQQKRSTEQGPGGSLPDELSSSEMDVAMKEFMDVSRAALRMGAREVHLMCLESRAEMPAFEEEIEEGVEEGLKLHPSLGPKRFVDKNGKVSGVETIRCVSVFDAQHRFNPQFEPGTEMIIPCDTAILAIGQASDLSFLSPGDGIEATRQGTVKIDPATLMTTAPGVFAAGDIAFGPRLIISAVADGKKAAEQIDRYLRGSAWAPKPQLRANHRPRPSSDGGALRRILAPGGSDSANRPAHRHYRSRNGLHGGAGSTRSFALSAMLDQYHFRGRRRTRNRVHFVRRLRGRLPRELPDVSCR